MLGAKIDNGSQTDHGNGILLVVFLKCISLTKIDALKVTGMQEQQYKSPVCVHDYLVPAQSRKARRSQRYIPVKWCNEIQEWSPHVLCNDVQIQNAKCSLHACYS